MNRAHQIVAAIRNKEMIRPKTIMVGNESDYFEALENADSAISFMCEAIEEAEKFDLSLVPFHDNLVMTGVEYLREGLFQPPFPTCYFDCRRAVIFPSGSAGDAPQSAVVKQLDDKEWLVCGFLKVPGEGWRHHGGYCRIDADNGLWVHGFLPWRMYQDADASAHNIRASGDLAFFAVALLSASGLTISSEEAPKTLNAQRERRGQAPLFSHHIVKVGGMSKSGGVIPLDHSRASPRLHWRRGHVRSLRSGSKTTVRPALVGDGVRGMVTHDYVVAPPIAPRAEFRARQMKPQSERE